VKKALIVFVALAAIAAAWWFAAPSGNGNAGAPTSTAAPGARNALLITLDTLRADRLGAYGHAAARTPNLDALAAAGVRFDDATAPAPITGPSHAAILTGIHPGRLRVRDNATTPLPAGAETIAEILAARGYATGGFVGAFILDRPYGFAQGFDTFDGFTRVDSGSEANAERQASAVVDAAVGWLAALGGDRPFFGWVHLYDAHVDYNPPAPFAQDYDGEIAFVDQQVGRLVGALRSRGALDDTLIVVIGDHGESLGEHGEDEHGVFLYDAVLRVPFIVAGPGARRDLVVGEQVRALDVAPTILDALGASAPAGLDGVSLARIMRGGTREDVPPSYSESHYPQLHYGWSELRAVRADGWKAIDAPRPELYNLRDDPKEQRNLYESQRALADRMIAEAGRLAREFERAEAVPARQPDRETLDRLRSLGYVGTSAALRPGERGPDPKDRIAERREFSALMSAAIGALRAGRPGQAVPKLQRLIEINGRAYDVHQFLGEAYERLGRPDEALGEYESAALLNPAAVTPIVAAAEVELKRGNVARATRKLDDAVKLAPQAYEVLVLTGRIRALEGGLDAALAAYERAAVVNPSNPRARTEIVGLATRVGRWDVAERHLRHLLGIGYQPARTHYALGRVAQAQGRNADAATHYREALRLEPGLTMAVEGLRSLGVR
jgi:choline-sulfatase